MGTKAQLLYSACILMVLSSLMTSSSSFRVGVKHKTTEVAKRSEPREHGHVERLLKVIKRVLKSSPKTVNSIQSRDPLPAGYSCTLPSELQGNWEYTHPPIPEIVVGTNYIQYHYGDLPVVMECIAGDTNKGLYIFRTNLFGLNLGACIKITPLFDIYKVEYLNKNDMASLQCCSTVPTPEAYCGGEVQGETEYIYKGIYGK